MKIQPADQHMDGGFSTYADTCDFTDSLDMASGCKHGYKQRFYANILTLVYDVLRKHDVGRKTGVAPAGERSAG